MSRYKEKDLLKLLKQLSILLERFRGVYNTEPIPIEYIDEDTETVEYVIGVVKEYIEDIEDLKHMV